jgi:hypothetical protein
MNEMDQLTRFRDTVPLEVTPRAEQLFRTALQEGHYPERAVVPRPRNPLTRIRSPWRLGIAVSAAAALVAGIVVAVLPPSPVVLTARLLADRASAAALTQPAVSPGQWVYRVLEGNGGPRGTSTEAGWETADGEVSYPDDFAGLVAPGDPIPSYSELGSLPASPAALDAYLARLVYPGSNPAPDIEGLAAFSSIEDMLSNYVLPPALQAEVYQALAILPGVQVDSHVTAIDGQAGVAFVLPPTPQSEKLEIILNASNYMYLASASWDPGSSLSHELAVVRMVIVGASPVTGAAATSAAAHSGDVTFAASMPATLTQQVSYRVQQLHTPGGPGPGSPAAVLVELLNAAGADVSGPGITLTVTGLSPHPGPGLAPGGTFTPVNLGLQPCYQLNVDTAGYPPGTYTLSFTTGTDPATHTAQFTVP